MKWLLILLLSCSLNLEGIEMITTFYPEGQIPEELSTYKDQGDLTVTIGEGWPVGGTITVWESTLMKQKTKKSSFRNSQGEGFAFAVGSKGYTPGMPVTFIFSDSKFNINKEVRLIPSRLIAKSNADGAEIEAEIVSLSPPTYQISPRGFLPNESLHFTVKSNIRDSGKKMSPSVPLHLTIDMGGKKGGVGAFEVERPSGESLCLELPWGLEWVRYVQYYDEKGIARRLVDDPKNLKGDPSMLEYFYPTKG